jgi:TRAP-type transport system periplasmic protein
VRRRDDLEVVARGRGRGSDAQRRCQTKWDLPAAYPAGNFHSVNLQAFADDVDKATGGKLKITVHPNASLFKAPEIKRAVQGGQAQIGEILLVNYQNEWQIFGADGLPFLADSYDERDEALRAQKPLLDKKLGEQGMMLLYAVPWPPQGIYIKKPIAAAADLKGVKWRAYSPATARIAELVGAQPVTSRPPNSARPWPPAWSRATCPAAPPASTPRPTSTSSTGTTPRPGCRRTRSSSTRRPSTRWTRRQAGAAEGRRRRRGARLAASKKTNTDSLDKLKANGMQILPPPPQLKADMKKVGDTMLKEWLDKAGPEGKQLVDAFRK